MKKGVLLSLIGLVCLFTGFGLFIAGQRTPALVLTLVGIGVYMYKLKDRKNLSGSTE